MMRMAAVYEKKRRSLGVYVVNESRESSNRLTINPKSDTSCAQSVTFSLLGNNLLCLLPNHDMVIIPSNLT